MPYIKAEDRVKFKSHIEQVLATLISGNEADYTKGEYFGYFVNRLVCNYMGRADKAEPSFNSTFFNEATKKSLRSAADHLAALMNGSDPLESAGDLNYVISSIYWGFEGAASSAKKARYGMRAYLTGIIDKICCSINSTNSGSQKEMAMDFRKHLIVRGVLRHVSIEEYRRDTSIYENTKIKENGDIWKDGNLS